MTAFTTSLTFFLNKFAVTTDVRKGRARVDSANGRTTAELLQFAERPAVPLLVRYLLYSRPVHLLHSFWPQTLPFRARSLDAWCIIQSLRIFICSPWFAMRLLLLAAAAAVFHARLSFAAPVEERCGPDHFGRKCSNNKCCSHAGFCVMSLPALKIGRPKSDLTLSRKLTEARAWDQTSAMSLGSVCRILDAVTPTLFRRVPRLQGTIVQ